MKITALIENTSSFGFPTEHGLSLFVETKDSCFLFDMGQTDRFAKNAHSLGIDLNAAEFAVLSHGHFDHGGGMRTFLELNDHAPVYINQYAFEPHYRGTKEYIGLDLRLKESERLRFTDRDVLIRENIILYPCDDAYQVTASAGTDLLMQKDGELVEEDFRHEQYLLVKENGKNILFSGCSHRGILNIMRRFRPDVLIGGFHFSKFPLDETLADCAKKLDQYPTVYYTGHCTGTEQYEFMKRYMKHLHYLSTGEKVVIE